MTRPTIARIHVDALRHNLARVRSLAPRSRVWAVVKAHAYGHGLAAALAGFEQADGLALVEFDAALRLRELGWRKPILMLEGAFDAEDTALAAAQRLSLVVHEPRQIDWLARLAPPAAIDVHLKVNTGMNRLGFPAETARAAFARLDGLPAVHSITWMTHFANADGPPGIDAPLALMRSLVPDPTQACSMANSAAIIDHPSSHAQWVRPGIMLYGATPFADRPARALGLRPAMSLDSRLIAVQTLRAGDAVGYGSAFVAPSPMRVGVVACGYADGYPRHAPGGTPVVVEGVRTRTVGRVSMDMITVDLTGVAAAQPGSPVQLWGDGLPIDEVATSAGTIGYELMCALAPRVPVVLEGATP